MDDFVVWGGSGAEWRAVCERVRDFLAAELKLELKGNTAILSPAQVCPGQKCEKEPPGVSRLAELSESSRWLLHVPTSEAKCI